MAGTFDHSGWTHFSGGGGSSSAGGGSGTGRGSSGRRRSGSSPAIYIGGRRFIGMPFFTPFTAPVPAVAINASLVPRPVDHAPMFFKIDAGNTGNAPVTPNPQAEADFRIKALLPMATAIDQNARYGGGAYAVAQGLTLSAPLRGLNIVIAPGIAMLDGAVEVKNGFTWAVPASTARVWIWLLQTGLPQAVPTSVTPPANVCCLLGSCSTDGANVTGIDMSGVVKLKNGLPWRQTADAGVPGDVPSSEMAFLHRTAGGLYVWDGVAYAGPI